MMFVVFYFAGFCVMFGLILDVLLEFKLILFEYEMWYFGCGFV